MNEVGTAILAISLVLTAVFVPTAFIPGISGQFYKQFAVTIAASTIISAINSLSLSPALAAALLKPHDAHASGNRLVRGGRWFAGRFNAGFDRMSSAYAGSVRAAAKRKVIMLAIYAGLSAQPLYGQRRAARLHPAARPGLCHRRHPAAGRLVAVPHRRGGAESLQDHAGHARHRRRGGVRRLLRSDLHQCLEPGSHLRPICTVRGTAAPWPVRHRADRAARRAPRRSSRPSSSPYRRRRFAASAMPAASRSSCRSGSTPRCCAFSGRPAR